MCGKKKSNQAAEKPEDRKPESNEIAKDVVVCHLCGCSAPNSGYTNDGYAYCSENCYLKEKEFHLLEFEINNAYLAFAEALAKTLDIREHETGSHSKRVACHTIALAKKFTDDKEILNQVYWGALLHDIGKIGISDAVLLKEGPLTESEWVEMRSHSELGYSILSAIPSMRLAADIVLSHEERYDGTGYPHGIAGTDIPWGARIIAVIDTLDAMTSDRPYRKGASFDNSKSEIISMAGVQFDPEVVDIFIAEESVMREMVDSKYRASHLDISK